MILMISSAPQVESALAELHVTTLFVTCVSPIDRASSAWFPGWRAARRVGRFFQDGFHDDRLAHDGGGLGQGHRRGALKRGLAGPESAVVVERVAQLVREVET